jgi:hypothetical protein
VPGLTEESRGPYSDDTQEYEAVSVFDVGTVLPIFLAIKVLDQALCDVLSLQAIVKSNDHLTTTTSIIIIIDR